MEAGSTRVRVQRVQVQRVHVYTRSPGEWIVFAAGHFDDRASFHELENAVDHGRRLAAARNCPLQVHGADVAEHHARGRR
jgi:hypothetical protein